jgi:hypothetical protein
MAVLSVWPILCIGKTDSSVLRTRDVFSASTQRRIAIVSFRLDTVRTERAILKLE